MTSAVTFIIEKMLKGNGYYVTLARTEKMLISVAALSLPI
jgi:hypothetical protein